VARRQAALTSSDVQFTFMEILRKVHSRGPATFAHLVAVDTPDPLTAIFRLDAPSPLHDRALAAAESPILPKHIYETGDPLRNPANTKPIGSGPFKFKEWQHGFLSHAGAHPDYGTSPSPISTR